MVFFLLGGKKIGDHGGKLRASALHHNSTLIRLNLERNRIGNAGVLALTTMLCSNTALRHLKLDHNTFDSSLGMEATSFLRVNSTLQSLLLSELRISLLESVNIIHLVNSHQTLTAFRFNLIAKSAAKKQTMLAFQNLLDRNARNQFIRQVSLFHLLFSTSSLSFPSYLAFLAQN